MLRREPGTYSSLSMTVAALPAFKPKADRSGKSRQIWIARHRPLLARSSATPDASSATVPHTPTSKPGHAAGRARSSKETDACAKPSSTASSKAGRPSRSPAGSRANAQTPASATRPSTASSTPKSPAPKTTAGATTSRAPRANADGAVEGAAALLPSSKAESPSTNAPRKPAIGKRQAIGKPTS